MSFLVDSGNPWERETIARCITFAVHESERQDKDLGLFVIEKLAEIPQKTERLYKVEIDFFGNYMFTLYTYGEPLEKKKEEEQKCKI